MQYGTYIGPTPITYYGCVECQREHILGIDPEYQDHLWRQSKHGVRTRRPIGIREEFVAHLLVDNGKPRP